MKDLEMRLGKEIANYLANETFITRMSEDMFMTVAKKEFRERWAK